MGCGIPLPAQELLLFTACNSKTRALAVIDGYAVKPVCVDDCEVVMGT